MPNRMIREEALRSQTLASLTPEAERLFWRLILATDDHGHFIAEPLDVRGRCLALVENVDAKKVSHWLVELEQVRTICTYSVKGFRYGHFPNWAEYQRIRSDASKYPKHEGECWLADSCRQLLTGAAVVVVGVEDAVEDGGGVVVGDVPAKGSGPSPDRPNVRELVPVVWRDPKVRDWLLATSNLKDLGCDRYAKFWNDLEAGFDQYQFVYFDEEIRRADAWLTANPGRKPVSRWTRWIHNWFVKAVEIGRRRASFDAARVRSNSHGARAR